MNFSFKDSTREYLFTPLLLSILFFIPDYALAQSANSCTQLTRYQEHCEQITTLDRCSREFTSICCSCQGTWNKEYEFCSFTFAEAPDRTDPDMPDDDPGTPAVDFGPPAQDPLLPELNPQLITCNVALRYEQNEEFDTQLSCGDEVVRVGIDASETSSDIAGELSYRYRFDCEQENANLSETAFYTLGGDDLINPTSESQAVFSTIEPELPSEYRCNISVQVEVGEGDNFARRTCRTALLVNNCDLGCQSNFIEGQQFTLDSAALEQKRFVTNASRFARRAGIPNRTVKKVIRKGAEYYDENWNNIWSMSELTKQCGNDALCLSISTLSEVDQYRTVAKKLFRLARKMVKRGLANSDSERDKKKGKKIRRRARKSYNKALAEADGLPTSNSECS